jgi:hypothetical protein
MATFHAGNTGTVTIGATELAVTGWAVDPSAEVARFRNSKTGGYTAKEVTWKEATFTIDVDYDFDANPFTTLGFGTNVTNVKLYLHGATSPFWNFPKAIVVGTPQRTEVDGKITTTFNLENDGTFSTP